MSALVAIGGGSLTVPFLTWCNVRVQHAIGTSAAVGFPIALGGSLGYIFNGWEHPGLPPVEPRLRLPAGVALAGAIEHADRSLRGKTGTPTAGGDLEAPFCRGADSAGRKDAVESLRVNRRATFLANGDQRPRKSGLRFSRNADSPSR
jgi:hypothetical protein